MKYFKFLRTGLLSDYDKSKWTIGKWRTDKKEIKQCVGLNASEFIQDALNYVNGEILAAVEVSGKIVKSSDKITCEKMKIIKTYKWTKTDSVKLAIFCAELSLPIFEKKYPNDNRPREAVNAAKNWLLKKSKSAAYAAADAARAADAADAADAAADAARAADAAAYAAYAAYAAAYAARAAYAAAYAAYAARADDAAAYAARAADAAAYAARAAAYAAALDVKQKIHDFIIKMKRIKI